MAAGIKAAAKWAKTNEARTVDNGSTPGWPFQLHLNCLFRPFPRYVSVCGGRGGGTLFFWLMSSPHKWTAKMLTKTQAECFPAQSLICLWGFSDCATFFPPMRVCLSVCESVAANSVSHLILWLTNTQIHKTHTHISTLRSLIESSIVCGGKRLCSTCKRLNRMNFNLF